MNFRDMSPFENLPYTHVNIGFNLSDPPGMVRKVGRTGLLNVEIQCSKLRSEFRYYFLNLSGEYDLQKLQQEKKQDCGEYIFVLFWLFLYDATL